MHAELVVLRVEGKNMSKTIKFSLMCLTISVGLLLNLFARPARGLELKGIPEEDRADALFPANLLKLDDRFSHHVLVVEKSTHKIHLYENDKSRPKFLKSFVFASGKNRGDKWVEGDLKTPEGIYQITEFKSSKRLTEQYGKEGAIYGIGAFVLNYPNVFDVRTGKTGDGIWFHGTNDETRISKGLDSRGCVVTFNNDVKEISQYIELDSTNMVIVEDLTFLKERTWQMNRESVEKVVSAWWKAWADEDLNAYISHYHPTEFKDNFRGPYPAFKAYKQAVFSGPGKPMIKLSNFSVLNYDKYAVVQFEQEYHSDKINDTGKKTLYLKRDGNYDWKIFAELWSKLPRTEHLSSFTPAQRYFN